MNFEPSKHFLSRWFGMLCAFIPSLASAHPGHYHPDETDEFDFLRSTIFHSHGALDYLLIGVAVVSIGVALKKTGTPIGFGACAIAVGSMLLRAII